MIGAGIRDRVVRIFKDVILGTVTEAIEVIVNGWGTGTLVHLIATLGTEFGFVGCAETHVVSFLLEPVEGSLGTIGTVTGRRVRKAVGRIGTTPARDL